MGTGFLDWWSVAHFLWGVAARLVGIPFFVWLCLHLTFELVENSDEGVPFLQKIKLWPGGKRTRDTLLNSMGDNASASFGWFCANWVLSRK